MQDTKQNTPGQPGPGVLTITIGAHTDWVQAKQIVRIQGEGNYSHVHTQNGRVYLVAVTLLKMGQRLPGFWRIHKSHLINPDYVDVIQKRVKSNTHLLLTTGDRIPISRQFRKEYILFNADGHYGPGC